MNELVILPRFVRDLRRYKRDHHWTPAHKVELEHLFDLLAEGRSLPPAYREHALEAEYSGFLECHLDEDWLLIYRRAPGRVVVSRTGTHAELFRDLRASK